MKLEPIVALEIGTSRVRVFVGEPREDEGLIITAVGDCASSGMRKGEVVDFNSLHPCVEAALRQAEEASNVSIHDVYLALSGSQIEAMPNHAEIQVDGEITAEHTARVRELAKAVTLPADREILHSIIGQYTLDGLRGVTPEGMAGRTLEVNVLIVYGVHSRMFNLVRVIQELKLSLAGTLFSGLCAAQAVLTPEQKMQGTLLIDLGGGTTDYVVYAQAQIADAGVLAVGGDHVTNDIARAFQVTTADAEALKIKYADAMVSGADRTRWEPLPAAAGGPPRQFKRMDMQSIVHLRMEETFGLIRERLKARTQLSFLSGGVVLTGGGAHLKNVTTLAEKVFGLPCTIGVPRNVSGLTTNLALPEYATGIGAVLQGHRNALNAAQQAGGVWKKIGRWFGVG
ncbi:MAG TPA: cell division protein FtsA [Kiritimatiellia bacterium]|jgi:cell division protein FtsA|nr:MAG: Cell division protein FtsA [Verrucomicrobia bacterium ADurb.Bin018]HOD99918.1 cell division protein FtsA [Kiritimatiellia bacterium]HOE37827.1 cell division protein FtsA [Kiritimatiellia bacterium]HOR75204.1 cell division protein FtsA [Kiritimatiellia bacterium]HOU59332.1 cell division protein FtsA [Kiritimatiellia bacterium]